MNAELRSDGWWLRFNQGEEAGPFRSMTEAEDFLDYVAEVQRGLKRGPDVRHPLQRPTNRRATDAPLRAS